MKTIRVRIAVAVDPDGNWNACGWSGGSDKKAMDIAVDTIGESEARYFVEAELPLPEPQTLQGEIKPA